MIFLLVCFPFLALAGQGRIATMLSPKLRSFLADHKLADKALDNVVKQAFSERELQVYYFYTDDESLARAFHYYPSTNAVVVAVRENQEPIDEFLCILFEGLNSEMEADFEQLAQKAQLRTISRDKFAHEMIRTEFAALQKTQAIVSTLRFDERDISNSVQYRGLMDSPKNFEGFLSYSRKTANRDLIKEYQEKYDELARP
jgi:hypothetical protein